MNKISLRECADAVIGIMRSLSYSEASIKQYKKHFEGFISYCDERSENHYNGELAIAYASQQTGMELSDLVMTGKDTLKYTVLLRSLRVLGEYSRSKTFTSRSSKSYEPFQDQPYWLNLYSSFMNYLKSDCDYANSTVAHKELTVRLMISILIQRNIQNLDEINRPAMEVIISQFIHEARKSVTHRIGEMKQFFQYCFDHNLSKENIGYLIPNVTLPHETKIPASWSEEEIKQLLDSIDRSSPSGKRDYAIVLIACRLGLRAVDIINLELSDFDWKAKTITVRQKKTRNTITLPLLSDIGWSVIDYIKEGRPVTDDPRVFIRFNSPYTGFSSSSAITTIVRNRMHDAGLNIQRFEKCGSHSLRHTLGSVLLEKETPLPVISQILGHRSIQSTETYLRINMSGLNECPIDPEKIFEEASDDAL